MTYKVTLCQSVYLYDENMSSNDDDIAILLLITQIPI